MKRKNLNRGKDPFKVRQKNRPVSRKLSVKTPPKELSPKDIAKLSNQARALITAIQEVKPLYDQLDEITLQLADKDITKYGLMVVDNFASENRVFKGTFVTRFQLKKIR